MGLLGERTAQVFMKRKILSLCIIGFSLLIACTNNQEEVISLPFYNTPDFSPHWVESSTAQYDSIHQIAPFKFYNQLGEVVDNKTFEGKIYAANFFFTICPTICLKMTSNIHLVQDAFQDDDDVLLLSHSVMPWVDSIPKLYDYAKNKEVINGKWHLITGDREEIYTLARNSYFAERDMGVQKSTKEFLHTENVILVDQKGRIRGIYNGTLSLEMKRLIDDIKLLKEMG